MLTDDQRRQIEMAEADRIRSELIERREQWGGLHTHRLRGLMDDLRATIVEEPWFGKPITEKLNDISRMVYEPDTHSVLGQEAENNQIEPSDPYGSHMKEDPDLESDR